MRSKDWLGAALAAAVALAGCAKATTNSTNTTAITPGPADKTGETYALKSCADINAPTPPASEQPYAITLGSSFELRNANAGHSGHAQGSHAPSHPLKTSLDVVTQISGTQSARISITLTDKSLHFMPPGLALRGATANAPSVFCDVTIDNASINPVLTFTVYPVGSNISASYNLGLLVDQNGKPGEQLPVIIDPWSDNNGIVQMRK